MITIVSFITVVGVASLLLIAAMRWYLSPDARTLSRLESERYSLFEVAQAELSALRETVDVRDTRHQQIRRLREEQERRPDKHAGEFLARKAAEAREFPARVPMPLAFPLLSRAQKLFVLTDVDLVQWVLDDATTFNRANTLESFAEAFHLNSVFTTKDVTLNRELRRFFMRRTNNLPSDAYRAMLTTLRRHVDAMLLTLGNDTAVPFIPKVEGMVLEAYADLFFGLKTFPDAEECGVLIKQVWQLKSLRNNVPYPRLDPLLWVKMRRLQNRLFHIIGNAQTLADEAESKGGTSHLVNSGCPLKAAISAVGEMAQVYISNGYARGNLLNALIPLYEAVARALVYALIELAASPSVQEQLYQEIIQNGHDELEYCGSTKTLLHRAWMETMRLRPPTPNQTRRVTIRSSPLFPYGSKVVVLWSLFHLDPRVWGPDAIEFRPDRWLDEPTREQEQHYHPFGAGVQKCVAKNYASFGGRVILKRIVETKLIQFQAVAFTTAGVGTDRGYSRGPDPDTSILRFMTRTGSPRGFETAPLISQAVDLLGEPEPTGIGGTVDETVVGACSKAQQT